MKHISNSRANKTGNVRITLHWGVLLQQLLQWKSSNYYICWVCVCVALFIQHAMRVHHSLLCPAPLYSIFSLLSHKLHDFRKKKKTLLNKTLVQWNLSKLTTDRSWNSGQHKQEVNLHKCVPKWLFIDAYRNSATYKWW